MEWTYRENALSAFFRAFFMSNSVRAICGCTCAEEDVVAPVIRCMCTLCGSAGRCEVDLISKEHAIMLYHLQRPHLPLPAVTGPISENIDNHFAAIGSQIFCADCWDHQVEMQRLQRITAALERRRKAPRTIM